MNYILVFSSVLGLALALFLLAQWRGWQPSLPIALAVGAALRGAVWMAAASQAWQPRDFKLDFPTAAAAVLHHHDPLLSGRPRGWPFLPTLAFVFAAELKLGQVTHLPWRVVGRLAPIVADLVLIPLIGKLVINRGRLRAFQYACNPLAIMISAIHGQLEPEVLALAVAAFVLARSERGTAAGVLLGLSVAVGSWSLLLLPGVLATLPDWRKRLRACYWVAGVPAAFLLTSPLTVGTPVRRLPTVAHRIIGLRSMVGNWGWTVAVTRGKLEFATSVGRFGVVVMIAALAVAGYLWRRADPVDLTTALLITFLVVSPRVSVQYLVWPLPFLAARTTRFAAPAIAAASAWAGFGYIAMGPHRAPPAVHANMWHLTSWDVIPLLIAAMPWDRRSADGAAAVTLVPQSARQQPVQDMTRGPAVAGSASPAASPEGVSFRT